MVEHGNNKNLQVELLRFVAALLVVFQHLPTVGYGRIGVDIFFVISGYVMMLSTANSASNFLQKRLIRVAPLYWVTTLGVFMLALLFPTMLENTTPDYLYLVKSLLFVPFDKNGVGHQPLLAVGWTLNYEMFFYLCFFVSMQISHRYRALISTGFLTLLVALLSADLGFLAGVYGDPVLLEFSLGMVLYGFIHEERPNIMVLVLLLIAAGLYFDPSDLGHRAYTLGPMALVIVWAVIKFLPTQYLSPKFYLLGGASYSLYLFHSYIIRFMDRVISSFQGGLFEQVFMSVFAVLASIAVAAIVYVFFERPVTKVLRVWVVGK